MFLESRTKRGREKKDEEQDREGGSRYLHSPCSELFYSKWWSLSKDFWNESLPAPLSYPRETKMKTWLGLKHRTVTNNSYHFFLLKSFFRKWNVHVERYPWQKSSLHVSELNIPMGPTPRPRKEILPAPQKSPHPCSFSHISPKTATLLPSQNSLATSKYLPHFLQRFMFKVDF